VQLLGGRHPVVVDGREETGSNWQNEFRSRMTQSGGGQ